MTQHAFDFDYLYYQYMPTLAVDSKFLTNPYHNTSILTLTFEGCKEAVGSGLAWYSRQDVYDRVLLWRIPLVALWATTTLPAFGLHTKVFTLMHLIADPIDTFWSLFYKLDLAKRNARWTRETDQNEDTYPDFTFFDKTDVPNGGTGPQTLSRRQTNIGNQVRREARLKKKLVDRDEDILQYYQDVVALIISAYDEWDLGIAASKAINYGFHSERWTNAKRAELRDFCASAAFYIASDRVSRFLPSVVSTIVFFIQITAGFWKTLNGLGDTYKDSDPVSKGLNMTPHNIAFGALFFWLPLAVLMTAFVGGSQTSHLVPRVLERFRTEVNRSQTGQDVTIVLKPEFEMLDFPDLSQMSNQRWARGGLPVWQTAKFRKTQVRSAPAERQQDGVQEKHSSQIYGLLISLSIVAIPTGCAMGISWLTPTQGFGCRAVTQLGFFGIWIVSLGMDWLIFVLLSSARDDESTQQPLPPHPQITEEFATLKKAYWATFLKDFIFTCGTVALLTLTALGVFNNCNCWCKWTPVSMISQKSRYLSFPQEQYIFKTIAHRLRHTFPIFIGIALISQIILFIGIAMYFSEGWRVLKQRDIDAVLEEPRFHVRAWRSCRRLFTRRRSMSRVPTLPILPDISNSSMPLIFSTDSYDQSQSTKIQLSVITKTEDNIGIAI